MGVSEIGVYHPNGYSIRKIMMIYWNFGVPNVQIHPASPFPHSPHLPELFDHRTLRAMFKEDETGKPIEFYH